MIDTPNTADEHISNWHSEWKRNRAILEGERAVKSKTNSVTILPRGSQMDDAAYRAMVTRTPFFPAAARTFDGLRSLIARKPATIVHPDNQADIVNTITASGYTLDDLADRIMAELMVTNFAGLLVDYPTIDRQLSQAQAANAGIRPFIALYRAETILSITTGVINNRQRVTNVRLLDDADTVRELTLQDGVYTIRIHKNRDGEWNISDTMTPKRGNKTIDEIPFTLVSTNNDFSPSKSPLSDVCSMNAQLFIASSNLAQAHWWLSCPIPYLIKKSGQNEPALSVAPGTIWTFDASPSEVSLGFLEYSGAQVSELRNEVESIKEDIAKIGIRMLASDKAAAEAAETLAIRRASENAILASLARVRDRKLNDALQWVSWWMNLDLEAFSYRSNTDFNAITMPAADLAFRKLLKDSGDISKDAFIDILISESVLPESFDREADQEKIDREVADRPSPLTGE